MACFPTELLPQQEQFVVGWYMRRTLIFVLVLSCLSMPLSACGGKTVPLNHPASR